LPGEPACCLTRNQPGRALTDAARATSVAVYFGIADLMVWRFVIGTPRRRRAARDWRADCSMSCADARRLLVAGVDQPEVSVGNYGALQQRDRLGNRREPVGGLVRLLFALIAAELFAAACCATSFASSRQR